MKLLAIETSRSPGEVALFDGDQLKLHSRLPSEQRTARSLAPTIHSMLQEFDWLTSDLDAVAVSNGPGSFTGLRIGIAFAKTLAYALELKAFSISTFRALAHASRQAATQKNCQRLRVIADAQRQEFFVQDWQWVGDLSSSPALSPESDLQIWNQETVERQIETDCREGAHEFVVWTGPGLLQLNKRSPELFASLDQQRRLAPTESWEPNAIAIGELAAWQGAKGEEDDVWGLLPNYGRISAAEEKANSR